jgi:hypothetical protein
MTRLLLNTLNAPALILLAAIGVALQTSLFASYPLLYFQPDIVLLIVIWCALRRRFTEGGILTLILANIAEIHSSSPQGLFLICYMLVFLLVRGASRVLVIPNKMSLIILTLCISILWKLSTLMILHLMGISANQWRHTLALLFPGAVVEGASAIWIYQWLESFDCMTYKSKKAQHLLEDELQLEGEGL